MADAAHSKCAGATRGGSNPPSGTGGPSSHLPSAGSATVRAFFTFIVRVYSLRPACFGASRHHLGTIHTGLRAGRAPISLRKS